MARDIVDQILMDDAVRDRKAQMFDEEVARQRTEATGGEMGDMTESKGPNWQIVAQGLSAVALCFGAYVLQQIKEQGDQNALAIAALQVKLDERIQRGEAEHDGFRAIDKQLYEAVSALNDKLQAEREERIRGDR